jgi:hypothetical protein
MAYEMGLFNLLSKKLTDEALRDSLFEAVASANPEAVRKMTARHADRIGQLFPTWRPFPHRCAPIQLEQNGGPKA